MAIRFGLMDLKIETSGDFKRCFIAMYEYLEFNSSIVSYQIDMDMMTNLAYGKILRFKNDSRIIRYRFDLTKKEFNLYEMFELKLWNQFKVFIETLDINGFYVIPYDNNMNSKDPLYFDSFYHILKTDEIEAIKTIFIKSLRYETFPVFVDWQFCMSFVPTDHLDLFMSFQDIKLLNKLTNISSQFELVDWL